MAEKKNKKDIFPRSAQPRSAIVRGSATCKCFLRLQAHKLNSTATAWSRKPDSPRICNKQEQKINYDNTPIHIHNSKEKNRKKAPVRETATWWPYNIAPMGKVYLQFAFRSIRCTESYIFNTHTSVCINSSYSLLRKKTSIEGFVNVNWISTNTRQT